MATFVTPQNEIKEQNVKLTQGTLIKQQEKKYYRFNAKLPIEYKDYLQEMAWRKRSTVTAILQDLVRQDMEKHPEVIANLNTSNA